MEIGLVIHGPEIVDSGMAIDIINKLGGYGNVSAAMAGTIGKTAVLDAHLEAVIDIERDLKPSRCIEHFFKKKDLVILLNHGKTTENGILFSNIVVSRLADRNIKPLIQIERPGMFDGLVVPWNVASIEFARDLADMLGLGITDLPELIEPMSVQDHGHRIIRNVQGVYPGEKIMVNGIIVGVAESKNVSIISQDGFIKDITGAKVKEHGLEKLHGYSSMVPVDLNACWIKSGPLRGNNFSIRKSEHSFRYMCSDGKEMKSISINNTGKIRAVIIDHEAERSFELVKDANVAVTIGDDTTDIAADILYRLRIPVIGITDGDRDGFSYIKHIYPGSTVLRLMPGSDDVVGKEIRENVFNGNCSDHFDSMDILRNKIFTISKKYIIFSTDY